MKTWSIFWLLQTVLLPGEFNEVNISCDKERPCSVPGFTACRSRYKRKQIFQHCSMLLDVPFGLGTNLKRRASAVFGTLEATGRKMGRISHRCCSSTEHACVIVNRHGLHSIACRR